MATTTISFGPRFHPRTAPVTFWYIIASAVLTIVFFFTTQWPPVAAAFLRQVMFSADTVATKPWTLLTYALLNIQSPFWLFLSLYVCWWVGSYCELWWGSRIQVGFMLAVAVGMALGLLLGQLIAPNHLPAMSGLGAAPLIAAWMTIFALRGPGKQIILFILPVPAGIVALITLASLWWCYGPIGGFFAVLGTGGLAWLYYAHGHRFHTALRRVLPDAKTREKRARDRRFRRLLRKSGLTDTDDRPN